MEIATVRGVYPIAVVVPGPDRAVAAVGAAAARSAAPSSRARDNADLSAVLRHDRRRAPSSSPSASPGSSPAWPAGCGRMAAGNWSFAAFDPSMSFVLLAGAIVGGLGTLHGPILGAIAVFAWPYLVARRQHASPCGLVHLRRAAPRDPAVLPRRPRVGARGPRAAVVRRQLSRRPLPEPPLRPEPMTPTRSSPRTSRVAFGGINAVDGVGIVVGGARSSGSSAGTARASRRCSTPSPVTCAPHGGADRRRRPGRHRTRPGVPRPSSA